jgi:DNA polymerase alpha-associated DNA helicase A
VSFQGEWIRKRVLDAEDGRMNQTVTKLGKMREEEYSGLIRVLFGLSSPSPVQETDAGVQEGFEWVDESLNDSQKEAIKFALASREVALIHGPPGVLQIFWFLKYTC